MYKILIVEDEDIIRKGLLYTVKWEEMDCMAVGEARNGVEGIKQIEKLRRSLRKCRILSTPRRLSGRMRNIL